MDETIGNLNCALLTPHIGAEISGVDLTKDLTSSDLDNIHSALMKFHVIFFRDQNISSENHKSLAYHFGSPHIHPAYKHVENHPEICILESTADKPTKIELWHTDMTFSECPPMGSFLWAYEIPPIGGDTMWASTTASYEALSDEMKKQLDGLKAVHSFEYGFKESIAEKGRNAFLDAINENPPIEHPVVRTHPVTGRKNLFVNRLFTTHIAGMDQAESDMLLEFLFEHMVQEEFVVRFKWEKSSFAIWDNRCTIHKPVNDYFPNYRHLRRITVNGDRPY